MPAALNEYISREKVQIDLGWEIKGNTGLNEVHGFIEKANIDQELILHIRRNHQTYRFIYSTLINAIHYFVNEEPLQNQFIQRFKENGFRCLNHDNTPTLLSNRNQ